MSDISSQSVWSINSVTQGAKQLTRLRSYDVTDDSSVETRNAVGRDKPIGFADKPGGCAISFDYYSERPKPEVDWRRLKDTKELFSLTQQIVGGERFQYPVCRVSNIAPSGDADGEHMVKVEIVSLGVERL